MRYFVLFILSFWVFAGSAFAAQTRCTTADLDLMCEEMYVLKGIDSDGNKICREAPLLQGCGSGYVLQGYNGDGDPVCVALPSSSNAITECKYCFYWHEDGGRYNPQGTDHTLCTDWIGVGDNQRIDPGFDEFSVECR